VTTRQLYISTPYYMLCLSLQPPVEMFSGTATGCDGRACAWSSCGCRMRARRASPMSAAGKAAERGRLVAQKRT